MTAHIDLILSFRLVAFDFRSLALALEKQIVSQKERARADARVRDVEGRPVVRVPVQVYEIYDEAEAHAVCEVAGDACQKERARAEHAVVRSRRAKEVGEDCGGGCACEDDEEPASERAPILHLPERDAAILSIREGEQAVDQVARVSKPKRTHSPCLRRLIRQINSAGCDEITYTPAKITSLHDDAPRSISVRASTQRSHAVG